MPSQQDKLKSHSRPKGPYPCVTRRTSACPAYTIDRFSRPGITQKLYFPGRDFHASHLG
jgi:hypothetical protein